MAAAPITTRRRIPTHVRTTMLVAHLFRQLIPVQAPHPTTAGTSTLGPHRVPRPAIANRAIPLTIDRVQQTVIQILPNLPITVLHPEATTVPRPAVPLVAAAPHAVPTADPLTAAAPPTVAAAHHAAAGADDKLSSFFHLKIHNNEKDFNQHNNVVSLRCSFRTRRL